MWNERRETEKFSLLWNKIIFFLHKIRGCLATGKQGIKQRDNEKFILGDTMQVICLTMWLDVSSGFVSGRLWSFFIFRVIRELVSYQHVVNITDRGAFNTAKPFISQFDDLISLEDFWRTFSISKKIFKKRKIIFGKKFLSWLPSIFERSLRYCYGCRITLSSFMQIRS